jgi:hypothetical protein
MVWNPPSAGVISDGRGRDSFVVRDRGGFLKEPCIPMVFKGAKQDNVSMPKPSNSRFAPARFFPSGCGRDSHIHMCGSKDRQETGFGSANSNFKEGLRSYGHDTEPLPGMNKVQKQRVSTKKKPNQNFGGLNRSVTTDQTVVEPYSPSPFAKKQMFNFPDLKKGASMDRRMDRNLDTLAATSGIIKPYVNPHKTSNEKKQKNSQPSIKDLTAERDALTKMLSEMDEESRARKLQQEIRALREEKKRMESRIALFPPSS